MKNYGIGTLILTLLKVRTKIVGVFKRRDYCEEKTI